MHGTFDQTYSIKYVQSLRLEKRIFFLFPKGNKKCWEKTIEFPRIHRVGYDALVKPKNSR